MTIHSDSLEQIAETGEDWLAMEHAPRNAMLGWCENHPALALFFANLGLWGAVACGFHFG